MRFTRWLVFALLLATLAPAISRALARTHGAGDWVELCSSQGMRWVQLGLGPESTPAGSPSNDPQAIDLCGHCTLAAERFAPLVPALPRVPAQAGRWPAPVFVAQAWTSRAAPSPNARGPPLPI